MDVACIENLSKSKKIIEWENGQFQALEKIYRDCTKHQSIESTKKTIK